MKIADYFRSQHASMKEESPEEGARLSEEPDAYFPPKTFGHHRYSDSRVEQKPKRGNPALNAYYPQQSLIDREKAFENLYQNDRNFRDDYDSPEGPEFPELGVPSRGAVLAGVS